MELLLLSTHDVYSNRKYHYEYSANGSVPGEYEDELAWIMDCDYGLRLAPQIFYNLDSIAA